MASNENVPFCWQDKRVLRRIREQIEDYGSAVSVYVALSIIASDTESEEFETTQACLGTLAGVSEKTVQRRTHDLERIGAILVERKALKSPWKYRLSPFGHYDRTKGHHVRTFGHEITAPSPTSEVLSLKAHVPTEKEFIDSFQADGIPEPYLRSKWAWFEGNNAWLDQRGRPKNFRVLVRGWWASDRPTWSNGKPSRPPKTRTDQEVERRKLLADLPFETGEKAAKMRARLNQLNETEATV